MLEKRTALYFTKEKYIFYSNICYMGILFFCKKVILRKDWFVKKTMLYFNWSSVQYLVDLLPLPVEGLPDRDDARYLVDVERLPVAVRQLLEPVAHLAVQANVGVASTHFHDAAAQGGVLEEKQFQLGAVFFNCRNILSVYFYKC